LPFDDVLFGTENYLSIRHKIRKLFMDQTAAKLTLLATEAAACRGCRLSATRSNVVFADGNFRSPLFLLGEAPGREEDLQGVPFVGRSGKLLDRLLTEETGITRSNYYIANIIKCRPPDNRNPLPDEVDACRHFLTDQISLVSPKVILALGNFAAKTLLQSPDGITKLRGNVFDIDVAGVSYKVVPTFHPSYVLRAGAVAMAQMRSDLVRAKRLLSSQ